MISRSTLLHLRIPFSIYLMPVFCFAASQSPGAGWIKYLSVWAVLHLFIYPASNGFNSYYDRDEDSIGGLEKPPKVSPDLLRASLSFDGLGLVFGVLIFPPFAVFILIYGLASKAYSHPVIRLKKYPLSGLLIVSIFQGGFTYIMSYVALNDLSFNGMFDGSVFYPALITSLMLFGSYPMTQIYQHQEDGVRGDLTISRILGIKRTFLFTAFFFLLTNVAFFFYFDAFHTLTHFFVFQLFLGPTLLHFFTWYLKVLKDPKKADFKNTMLLNKISSISMIAFFTLLQFWPF